MDAVDLREKLHTLVNKLLDEEIERQKTCGIKDIHHSLSEGGGGSGDFGLNSWEATMNGLARELETICSRGSSPRDSPNVSPCLTPTNGISNHTNSRRIFSLASGQVPHQGSLCEFAKNAVPRGVQQVRVRHEETEDRLDQSLSVICRQNSSHGVRFSCGDAERIDGGEKRTKTARSPNKLSYKDSLKYGLRFRLDLDGRDPDRIAVSMNQEDHILRVFFDGEIIHLLQLAENTNPQTLSCMILDGTTLFVKQRSKEMMCLEYEGGSELNLPVARQDESTLTMNIGLRVPSGVGTDDIIVKTIDDTLMIRTGGCCAGDAASGGVRFRVAMKLPDGTDNRSVNAWVTKGQLTITGHMIAASRRMTCAF